MMTPKSGIYLAIACVAAIAAVGSIFEIASGSPDLGNGPTAAILAGSLPLGGFCFYAAIASANAER